MQRSDSIHELLKALTAAQAEFPLIERKSTNPFHHSNYADLPTVISTVRPILARHGLGFTHGVEPNACGDRGAAVHCTLFHAESGEWLISAYPFRPGKDDPQAYGSAYTYARRYTLQAVLGVVAEGEDDDAEAASGRRGGAPATPATAPSGGGLRPVAPIPSASKPAAAAPARKPAQAKTEPQSPLADRTPPECPDGHGAMRWRQGISSKNHRPYAFWGCSERNCPVTGNVVSAPQVKAAIETIEGNAMEADVFTRYAVAQCGVGDLTQLVTFELDRLVRDVFEGMVKAPS